MKKAEEEVPGAVSHLTPEIRRKLIAGMQDLLKVEGLKGLSGKGAIRYERRLKAAGLDAPQDRPIPDDLDQALKEFGVIRDCLIHRGGRTDPRALELAPTLGSYYRDGDLIRLGGEDYRTYSAAIRCYAAEVIDRLYARCPGLPKRRGETRPSQLAWPSPRRRLEPRRLFRAPASRTATSA